MKFEKNKIFKIVYQDDSRVKSPRGYIIDYDDNFIALEFLNSKTKLFINCSNIISISEVDKCQ